DRVVVELLHRLQRREAPGDLRGAVLVELRGLLVLDRVEREQHGVGIEGAAVVEFHVSAQLEDPLLRIALADLPGFGEPGHQRGQLVTPREVPVDERLVDLVADEAEALEAVVRLAAGVGNVGRGHTDPQGAFRPSASRERERQHGDDEQADESCHDGSPLPRTARAGANRSGTRWQRATWPAATPWSGGGVSPRTVYAGGRGGATGGPAGSAARFGGAPGMGTRARPLWPGRAVASIKPSVYGCAGAGNSPRTRACWTMRPPYMTAA